MLDKCEICGFEQVWVEIPAAVPRYYGGDIVEEESSDLILVCPNSCSEETGDKDSLFDTDDIPF